MLTLRVRMPIVQDLTYPRNFITKIIKYDKVSSSLWVWSGVSRYLASRCFSRVLLYSGWVAALTRMIPWGEWLTGCLPRPKLFSPGVRGQGRLAGCGRGSHR